MKFRLKYVYTIFCLYIYIYGASQNLVPNGNFEVHFDCNAAIIESSSPWCGVNAVAYLNACISHPYYSVPSQSFSPGYPSYQIPHSGNAYATFGFILPTQPTAVSRYPHVKLIDTLQAGKTYCVTYYVSLWNDCKYSTDKFGVLFTVAPFNCTVTNQTLTTGYTPQVVSTPGVLYDDTLNWQEVSGTFVADGTEAYLTLGNFFPQAQHTYSISYPASPRPVGEYYLDDVSVEEVQAVFCRNDTNIVLGDSIIVGANLGEANLYNWQPMAGLSCTNCPNPKASPNVTTTYTVTKTQCHVTTTDVITVSVSPTGIRDISYELGVMSLVPNPTNGIVTVTCQYDFQKIELLSVAGQVLLSEQANSKTHSLQLQNYAEGIYFVKVSYANGLSTVKKVIKN